MKTKTVNLTGKKLVKKALVVSNKKTTVEKKVIDKVLRQAQDEVKTADAKAMAVKEDKKYELTVGLKDLLEAGCHLGHKVSKTHPKAKENIYLAKDGIQIVDLTKTLKALQDACNFVYNAQRNGKKIVLIGTKRQAREVVRRVATDAGVAYVTDRWLGGTITNWEQIRKDIRKFLEIRDGLANGKYVENTKKEILDLTKEKNRLERLIGGLITLDKLFDIIFVVDAGFEKTAIKESKMRGIKSVAIVDTDADPRKVDFAIPANDDNNKSVTLIVEEIGKAIKAAGVK